MKVALLFICIALIFASAEIISNKRSARTVNPETPSLQIEFQGTCEEFRDRVLQTVTISSYTECLPLRVQPGYPVNPEIDDLHAHYFCTDKSKGRSIHHFVEIFETSTNEYAGPDFILALKPSAPFRVITKGTTLSRRPDCKITEDYCNSTNPIVSSCTTNNVATKKGWALNDDRIYITAHAKVTNDCKNNAECCNYIIPSLYHGICPHHANEELLPFHEKEHDDHREKHDGHKESHKEHDNKHHNDGDHDRDDGYGRKDDDRKDGGRKGGDDRKGDDRKGDDRKGDDRKDNGYGRKDDDRKDGGRKDGEREGGRDGGRKDGGKPKPKPKEEDEEDEE